MSILAMMPERVSAQINTDQVMRMGQNMIISVITSWRYNASTA